MKPVVASLLLFFVLSNGISQTKSSGVNELSYLLGKWKAVTKVMTKSGTWKETTTDTVEFSFIKKGNYLKAVMGGQYDYELIFSYDQFQGKYRMSSIDQVSGLLDIYEGNLQEGKLVIDNVVKDTYYTIGATNYYNRLTLSKISTSEGLMLIEGSDNRGEKWQPVSQVSFYKL